MAISRTPQPPRTGTHRNQLESTGTNWNLLPNQLEPTGTKVKPTGTELEPTGTELELTGTKLELTGTKLELTGTKLEPTGTNLAWFRPGGTGRSPLFIIPM